jgi:hypothetical protein
MRNAGDSATLAYAGAVVVGNSGRSRLLILAVVAFAIIAMVIVLYTRGLGGNKSSSHAPERAGGKTMPCYSDEECPDGTFCSDNRLCVPTAALPPLAPPLLPLSAVTRAALGVGESIGRAVDRVLGRGRGGEGADVQKVSIEDQGQML